MGLGVAQLEILERLIRPGMRVISIGRLSVKDKFNRKFWFDRVVETLGASASSIDISALEGATISADLNKLQNWPAKIGGSFDLLIDAGSLEHMSNTGIALKNFSSLVRTGGRIFLCNPTEGYAGHGFYQFSPEFYFRTFSEINGFQVEFSALEKRALKIMSPLGYSSHIYDSPDPKDWGGRLIFREPHKVQSIIVARKVSDVEMTMDFLQSDYEKAYSSGDSPPTARHPIQKKRLFIQLWDWLFPIPFKRIRRTALARLTQRLGARPFRRYNKTRWQEALVFIESLNK